MFTIRKTAKILNLSLQDNYVLDELGPFYPRPNENVGAYYPLFDIEGREALVTGSSGGQTLMCILYGAEKIDIVDKNVLAYFYIELLFASIQVLPPEIFFEIYYKNPVINWNLLCAWFDKINQLLPKDVSFYWTNLLRIKHNHYSDLKHLLSLDRIMSCDESVLMESFPYLQPENYYLIRSRLTKRNIFYLLKNVKDLVFTEPHYDFINLSNIAMWLRLDGYEFADTFLSAFVKSKLKDDGQILFDYVWPYYDMYNSYETLFSDSQRFEFRSDLENPYRLREQKNCVYYLDRRKK